MPTVYNKVTINDTTYIDLSQDTVADASHIRQGYVGHLNDGTTVTGTFAGSGVDIPVFELQFDSNGDFVSATCNKTWAECEDAYNNGDGSAYARAITEGDPYVSVIPLSLALIRTVGTDDIIDYVGVLGAQPVFDVLYHSDGQIDFVVPSTFASELTATTNGTYTPQQNGVYTSVTVNVPSGSPNLQAKTNINPTTASQTIQPDSGYDGLSSVQINAMPSGTAGTPTATKGTVSNHSVSVTPSVTNTTGYITGSTKTGTAVTVNVAELESGTKSITENGTGISVSGYSTVDVAVPTGSSKALYKYEGLASRTANSYGATSATVTVTKAGTYNISYVAIRGSSSGTMGTNLHIGDTAKGNQQTWNNGTYGQYVSYTNQSISANTAVTIYATSGSNSRTVYTGQLIVEEA